MLVSLADMLMWAKAPSASKLVIDEILINKKEVE